MRDAEAGLLSWIDILLSLVPFSTAMVGGVAALIALFTLGHRRRVDSRAERWRRVEYAMDLTREVDRVGRNTGMQLLIHLLDDRRWDTNDVRMQHEANEILVLEILERSSQDHASPPPSSRRGRLLDGLVSWNSVRRSR